MSSRRSAVDAPARRAVEARARAVVDYALVRRAALADLAAGRTSTHEACDAQAYLLRAARYHGEPAGEICPVCQHGSLVHVSYTFGDCFRADVNGRARAPRELVELADQHPEFNVYLVEVCAECRWNHLLASYVLGTGEPAKKRARS
ncbi:MAG: hypothetical protein QOJ03_320 [Frankiaceae bacterium]|jgi:hypothetical protein|nr:hypothetical protein [Frankiaceae bacterium]